MKGTLRDRDALRTKMTTPLFVVMLTACVQPSASYAIQRGPRAAFALTGAQPAHALRSARGSSICPRQPPLCCPSALQLQANGGHEAIPGRAAVLLLSLVVMVAPVFALGVPADVGRVQMSDPNALYNTKTASGGTVSLQ